MVTENKANFVVNLVGNVAQKARAFGGDIAAMGEKGSRSMRLLSAATHQTNRILDIFDNKVVGFATGGGAVVMAKKVGDWQQKMADLSTQFNLTNEDIEQLNQSIWSSATHRKLPYSDVIDAISQMLERTNDIDSTIDNIDNIALAIKGIGLSAEDAGRKIGILKAKGYSKDDIHQLLNDTANASKFGTGDISAQFNRVVDMSTATNWTSPEQLRQLLAIERLGDSTFGNSEQSTAAMQSFYSALLDRSKQNILRQNGVDVFSNNKTGELRDPMDIFLDMANATGFKKDNIESISGGDLVELMKSFKDDTRQQELRHAFKGAQANLIDDKASRNIQTFNGALTSLTNAGEKWAQLKLAKPIQDLADAINSLTPEQLDEYAKKLEMGAKLIGGAVAARYLYKGRQMLGGILSPTSTGGLGGAINSAADAGETVPVYVTNWNEQSASGNHHAQDPKKGIDPSGLTKGWMDKMMSITAFTQEAWDYAQHGEGKTNFERHMDKLKNSYDEDNEVGKYAWLPASLDNGLQNLGKSLNAAMTNYGEALAMQSQLYVPSIQPPTGEIVLKVESDSGLAVKATSVTSPNMGLTVDVGGTRGHY